MPGSSGAGGEMSGQNRGRMLPQRPPGRAGCSGIEQAIRLGRAEAAVSAALSAPKWIRDACPQWVADSVASTANPTPPALHGCVSSVRIPTSRNTALYPHIGRRPPDPDRRSLEMHLQRGGLSIQPVGIGGEIGHQPIDRLGNLLPGGEDFVVRFRRVGPRSRRPPTGGPVRRAAQRIQDDIPRLP